MLDPIRKSITVPWDMAHSFQRFTEDMGSWWPLKTHSVGGTRARGVVFEGRVGGRILEQIEGGEQSVWGTVTVWNPPLRVAFTWHPGGTPNEATLVELSFSPTEAGTRLDLVHSRWEALGHIAKIARRGYPIGWAYVLRHFSDRRGSAFVRIIDFVSPVTDFLQERMKKKLARQAERAASSS